MTREEIISGLKFTVEMFLFNPSTGEYHTEPQNDMDRITIDACKGAIELLEQEHCEDAISRQAAIDAVRKNTFRLTFAEERSGEGHVAWSAKAVYSDVIEGALLELPSVTPQPKTGHWIHFAASDDCSECRWSTGKYISPSKYCPNCGAKMQEVEEWHLMKQ